MPQITIMKRAALSSRSASLSTYRNLVEKSNAVDPEFQVVGAVQTVLSEEWAHHQFATRDLARHDQLATEAGEN